MGSQSTDGGLGQEFTSHVIQAMGPNTTPRMRTVLSALIQHVHDFAREVNLTTEEWLAGVEMINWAGRMSNDKRNEGQLVCDVIGLESLVDDITYREASKTDKPPHINGTTITFNTPKDGVVAYMHGQVTDAETGKPLPNTSVDVWQASTNGLYEQQDDDQIDCNLRGKFITDAEGRYSFYCLRPTPYPIPFDGPAGKLLKLMDRHEFRPAHIHLIVQSEGYSSLTTQIFDKDSKYLEDDSVFAVKDGLTVEFKPRKGDSQAEWDLEYDVKLAKKN
ncbi:hypothetical protein TrVGV298_003395 [Trichoderma virens]|nr:hypothetical protein TrVGV298_003395 [Trichoderma virens]